ncbi:protein spaetzle 4-like [Lycorma delicatula]|uniref:protein spaetzle 4-like n=1 Tax=Lycorma delicatula TaxID=130591 RepID=UPI003F51358E
MKISLTKTKLMAFLEKFPIKSKIILGDKILEQVSHFNYLGCDITYENDRDCNKKISRFQAICGTIRRTLHRKVLNETQMKFYKVMAVRALLYGSEGWILSKRQLSKIQAMEMTYLHLLFLSVVSASAYGYDGYTTCSKPYRSSKSRIDLPCDFRSRNWCTIPGSSYPWRAVRRFVFENHGLMRRMYGDERHISVLRSEIESNDVDYQSEAGWSFHDSILKNYQPKNEPRSTVSTSTTSTTTTTTTTSTTPSTTSTTSTSPITSQEPIITTTGSEFSSSTISDDDPFTTEVNFESTTVESEQTTKHTEPEHSSPQLYKHELFEKQQTTEETPLYKLRGVNACPVKEEVVAPFWANNTRGEVLALLNLYPFEQYVHWERCTFENKQMFCRQGCRCEQQYRLHRLLAYDPSNDCRGIFSDWFKFPSCCVCRCYDLPSELRLTSRSPRTVPKEKQPES